MTVRGEPRRARRATELEPDDPRTLGPFALSGRLGSGGMGVVYLADDGDGRAAAVKVVHPHLIGDPDFRARFGREIAVARAVDAPWTARVLDADPHGTRPWLATEFVDGPALDQHVGRTGALPTAALEILALRLAESLAALHGAGVVHRDLKPSNVLLADDGPRLIDFGIARSLDATKITHSGLLIGTPAYMAPEQAEGEESGPPADVFSLASVLYFAATGQGPFGSTPHPAAMLLRVMQRTPDVAALPAPLRDWLAPCFAKDPADRPTAAQLVRDWTATEPVNLTKQLPPPTVIARPDPPAVRLLRIANVVLALLAVAALAAAALWTPTTTATPTATAAPPPDGALPPVTKVAEIALDDRADALLTAPDGRTLAVVSPSSMRFVDTATRAVSPPAPAPADANVGTFSADSTRLYIGGRGISVFDVRSRTTAPPIGDAGQGVSGIALAIDGRTAYLTHRDRDDIAVVDLTDGRETATITVGNKDGDIAMASADRLVVYGHDGAVVVDPGRRATVGRIKGPVVDVTLADDGHAYVVGYGSMQRVDLATAKADGPPIEMPDGNGYRVHRTPSGALVLHTVIGDELIHILDGSGLPRQIINVGARARVWSVSLSPDGATMYALVKRDNRFSIQVYATRVLAR